jgi:tetratricopeptide (TPR) repeat protein
MRSICRLIIGLFVLAGPYLAKAQFVSERSALNNISKGKWERAKNQLTKIIEKDSIHAGAQYAWSVYFFSDANPDFQIDSAYEHIQQAIVHFSVSTPKQRQRLLKIPVDSLVLLHHRQRIDSAAFQRALKSNTELAYIDFINRFTTAQQQPQAVDLRDAVAFEDAAQKNTYEAFLNYVEKYPQSRFATEAKIRYDRLLFQAKTANQKLATYEAFLEQYPETPYRKEVEQQIFEKLTATGEATAFERFIKKYPKSSKIKQAKNILYHVSKEGARALAPLLVTDSLRSVQALDKFYLTPFLQRDMFGFINEMGEEQIKPMFKTIPDDYICGNLTDELLLADDRVITRKGITIYEGAGEELEAIGYGFFIVTKKNCSTVLHASGFVVGGCVQDAKLLAKNYLLLKKNNRWSVWTLTGRMVVGFEWDEIQLLGDVVVLQKNTKLTLAKLKDLAASADQQPIAYSKPYDEVKPWNDGLLWVRNGSEQAVLTQTLTEWIKPARQQLVQTFFGATSQTAAGYVVYPKAAKPSSVYYRIKVQQPWVVVQQDGVWKNIDPVTHLSNATYDSVSFIGPFLLGIKGDSVNVHLNEKTKVLLPKTVTPKFVSGKDSLFFLMFEEGNWKTLYTSSARQLFTLQADNIEYNNEGYFTITQKQKKGILSMQGKFLLMPEYDAIGSISEGIVTTLKDKKFGMIDLTRKKIIKPEYDKNIIPYGKTRLIASRNTTCGLIGWDNKPIIPFEFEEVRYWSDSTALVKKNFHWLLYNFVENTVVVDRIRSYKIITDTPHEKIIIAQQENTYGVISSTRGMFIPATFSDIVNVGSASVPLYFTEKHVEEASIFVVIYYDKNGVQLRKQVYEADDYEKIYCSGN